MKDILCPKCQKDEIGPFYLLDSKDINGDFIKCPRCGSTKFSKTIDLKYRADYIWIDYFLSRSRSYVSPQEYEYMCLNKNCYFLWNSSLDLMYGR